MHIFLLSFRAEMSNEAKTSSGGSWGSFGLMAAQGISGFYLEGGQAAF